MTGNETENKIEVDITHSNIIIDDMTDFDLDVVSDVTRQIVVRIQTLIVKVARTSTTTLITRITTFLMKLKSRCFTMKIIIRKTIFLTLALTLRSD